MNELQNKVLTLKLKKALLFAQIEKLSEVDETLFTQLGKVQAEIMMLQKKIFRNVENHFEH